MCVNLHILVSNGAVAASLEAGHQQALTCLITVGARQQHARAVDSLACELAEMPRQADMPLAAIRRAALGAVQDDRYWLIAQPVHLVLQRDYFSMYPPWMVDAAYEEYAAMIAALRAHFSIDGLDFSVQRTASGEAACFMSLPADPEIQTHEIAAVAGRDIRAYLPKGKGALTWHGIVNEMQMLLSSHPVNQQREATGKLPLNSIWLYGGGFAHPSAQSGAVRIYGQSDWANAFARMAGTTALPVADVFDFSRRSTQTHVLLVDNASELPAVSVLRRALKLRRIRRLSFYLPVMDGTLVSTLGGWAAWKPWTASTTLQQYFEGTV
jgi:hypothetical protein